MVVIPPHHKYNNTSNTASDPILNLFLICLDPLTFSGDVEQFSRGKHNLYRHVIFIDE